MVMSYQESLSVVPSGMTQFQGPYQILVTALEGNSVVRLRFQFCSDSQKLVVEYNSNDYKCGDELVQTLDAFQNLQVKS